MGDRELVPHRAGHRAGYWAYAGDSIARRGYIHPESPRNTDIGTQITEFTGGKIQFDNYGRSGNTAAGMLGKQKVRGRSEDTMSRMLEKNYEGIIIEIGVNDLGGRGGRSGEKWLGCLGRMQKNVIDMYVRAYVKGAGAANQGKILGQINSSLSGVKMAEEKVREQLMGRNAAELSGFARVLEKKKRILARRRRILENMREAYVEAAKKTRKKIQLAQKTGGRLFKIVFVEVAPWKPAGASTEKAKQKALRTLEYNEMLGEAGKELNRVFGPLDGPEFVVAKIHGVMGSMEDDGVLCPDYVGEKANGTDDYLHFGERGREAAAAAITLQVFPGDARNPQKLEGICLQNRSGKRSGTLARR